ncbi:ABC transporter permease [bacterium]|jgi:peptide/nickel transport system permease protein|nr:ABC transporter permease [bacterium]
MRGYAIRRGFAALIVVILVSVFVFIMMHLLPGDALLVKLGQTGRIPPDRMAALREQMGLNQPLYEQYFRWVGDIFNGSMGHSLIFDGQTVSGRIGDALPITLELGVLGLLAGVVLGVPIGILSAVYQDRPIDYGLRVFSLTGLSLPQFWIGLIVIIYGTRYLGYSPPTNYTGLTTDPIQNLKDMWIPALILGYGLSASTARMMRSTVLEAFHEDYVRTARAKGLAGSRVVYRHVLRNAVIPVITLVGNQTAYIFSGALILEILFGFPGLGQLTYTAILQRDYTQVEGNALVTGGIVVGINLLVDLSYGWIDPRIRYV